MLHGMKLAACGAVAGLAILLLSGVNARCEDEKDWWATATDPKNFSATVTFTTDYVLRGISQTDSKPAVQGSLDYKHPSGAYVGIWGSNVDDSISKGDLELDIYGGYTFELFSNFNLDASIIYYYYPGCGHDPSKNYFEGRLGVDYTFKDLPLEPKLSGAYYYSPDYFGEDGDAFNGVKGTVTGLFYGDGGQLVAQCIGIATNIAYVGVIGYVVFKLLDVVMGLRVDAEQESEGLDQYEVAVIAYPDFQIRSAVR